MNNRDRAQELAMHLRLQWRQPIRSFAHPRRHILRNFAHYSSVRAALALVEDAAVTIAVVRTWARNGMEEKKGVLSILECITITRNVQMISDIQSWEIIFLNLQNMWRDLKIKRDRSARLNLHVKIRNFYLEDEFDARIILSVLRRYTINVTKYLYLHVGKVSLELSAKNSVHEVSSCSLDIRRHATIVLTSHPNVTAAREEMYVATTARRSWDGDAIFTTQLSRFMRISANVPARLARSRSRRDEHDRESDRTCREAKGNVTKKTMFFHRYKDVCVSPVIFYTNFSPEKFVQLKYCIHSI